MIDNMTIAFAPGDIRDLQRQMRRAESVLGKDTGQAVKFAAWAVARSLGASTRVAKQYRPYKAEATTRKKVKKFVVTSHRRGGANTFPVYAPSVAALKKMPQVRIGNKGLAKGSWMWGIRALGSVAGSGAGVGKSAKRYAQRWIDVGKQLRGNNPTVTIHNRLSYILNALRGGPQDVTTAMARGARQMEKIIDAKAKKAGFK